MEQVFVFSMSDMGGDPGEAPFRAVLMPDWDVSVSDIESRDAAPADFVLAYNSAKNKSLTEEDFRFFGPLWAQVKLMELESGEWQAHAIADTVYSVTMPTEQEAKDEWLALWNSASISQDFPHACEDHNVYWDHVTELAP